MGAENSKPEPNPTSRRRRGDQRHDQERTPSTPTGGPVMVPPTYRDASGRPITHEEFELDRNTIIQALDHMGQYLEQRGASATVILVGGAVNTVYLQSRRSTHDVDFFLAVPNATDHTLIHEAARSAARSARSVQRNLGANWFNNATQLLIGREIQAYLVHAAIEQDIIVHEFRSSRGGIVAYAAPWSYAFCGKLNRISEGNPRQYDTADAVAYLHEYIQATENQTVSAGEIKAWCDKFRKAVTDSVLKQVNAMYFQTYGVEAITKT